MSTNGNGTEFVEGEVVDSPIDRIRTHMGGGGPVQRVDVQENAMLDIQIVTAKRYPRSIAQFRREALDMATLDQETAMSCFYSLPRGGKPIQGPSVRLAEICAAAWGHIHATTSIFEIGQKEVIARAVAWDMQSNLRIGVENRRRIVGKDGRRFNDDMILVTCNAALSIALRNAIFRIIPGAYVHSVMEAARKVANGNAKTIEARRADMIAAFGKMGVTPDRLLKAIDAKGIEDIGIEDITILGGFFNAIKDGAETVESCFPVEEKSEQKKTLAEKIAKPDDSKPQEKKPEKPAAKKQDQTHEQITNDQADEIDVAMQHAGWTINEVLAGFKTISGGDVMSLMQLSKEQASKALANIYASMESKGE